MGQQTRGEYDEYDECEDGQSELRSPCDEIEKKRESGEGEGGGE